MNGYIGTSLQNTLSPECCLPTTPPINFTHAVKDQIPDRDAENREIGSCQQNSRDRAPRVACRTRVRGAFQHFSGFTCFPRILVFWITKTAGSGDLIELSLGLMLVLLPIERKAKEIDKPLRKRFRGFEIRCKVRFLQPCRIQSFVIPTLTSML